MFASSSEGLPYNQGLGYCETLNTLEKQAVKVTLGPAYVIMAI